jgi:hypothetical protein
MNTNFLSELTRIPTSNAISQTGYKQDNQIYEAAMKGGP